MSINMYTFYLVSPRGQCNDTAYLRELGFLFLFLFSNNNFYIICVWLLLLKTIFKILKTKNKQLGFGRLSILDLRLNSIKIGCKTHVLHHSISYYQHFTKIQYILSHLIISR